MNNNKNIMSTLKKEQQHRPDGLVDDECGYCIGKNQVQ